MAVQHVTALSQQQRLTTPGGMGQAGVLAESNRQDDYLQGAVRTSDTQSSLRALAEGTGGFLIANTNDLRKPFLQIAEDSGTHYEADYHPSSGKYDGRFRKIEVKLKRNTADGRQVRWLTLPAHPKRPPFTPVAVVASAGLRKPTSSKALRRASFTTEAPMTCPSPSFSVSNP